MELTLNLMDLENFYQDAIEDYALWDTSELGSYPPDRILVALKKFIDNKRNQLYIESKS
jgi:hypothetical protein